MKRIKKIINLTLSAVLLALAVFVIFESEITDAAFATDSATVTLSVTSSITITPPAGTIVMPALNGMTGGISTNSVTWTVKTNNDTGYHIGIKASTDPALKTASYSFANYTPVGLLLTPDYTWNIGSAVSEFGYAPYNSVSQDSKFKNNSSACATGSTVTAWKCWYLFTTADTQVANLGTKTGVAGEDTTLGLEAQIDAANGYQEDGAYSATITATATEN